MENNLIIKVKYLIFPYEKLYFYYIEPQAGGGGSNRPRGLCGEKQLCEH